jgi:hypothetical protein
MILATGLAGHSTAPWYFVLIPLAMVGIGYIARRRRK